MRELGVNQPLRSPKVTCPQCQAVLSVPNSAIGSEVTCSDCLEDFVATVSDEQLPTQSESAPELSDDGALNRLLNPTSEKPSSDLGTIRLDDDSPDENYIRKKVKVLESNYEFTTACMLCGTRVDVNDSLIGKKVKCPDCHSPIEVRTPSPEKRRAPFHVEPKPGEDDEFRIADLPVSTTVTSPYHSIANDLMAAAESEVAASNAADRRPAPPQRLREPGLDSLKRAEESASEVEDQDRPPLPAAPFRTGVLKFLIDPLTVARLIVLALALFTELAAVQAAVVSAEGGPIAQFISVVARMGAVVLGILLAVNLAVSLLGILSDTANGKDNIESWPDVNFLDWIGESLYVFSALFLAVLPGAATAQLTHLLGMPVSVFWTIMVVGCGIGITTLFPFILVSMLEAGSPILPVSQPISQSLRLARGSWIVFTMASGCLVVAGCALCAVRLLSPDYTVLNLIVAILLVLVIALYFRLVGRLTWCCDEAVLAEQLRLEETVDGQE